LCASESHRSCGHLVEFGWFEYFDFGNCSQKTNGNPFLLAFWKDGTVTGCSVTGYDLVANGWVPPAGTSFHDFTIDNSGNDYDFDFYLDLDSFGGTGTLSFTQGFNIASTERTGTSDIAYGRFNDTWHQNGSGWHRWDFSCVSNCGSGLPADNDPDYRAVRLNGTDYDWEMRAF
jgi:hypothetical protein